MHQTPRNQKLGALGEAAALELLERQGYVIRTRNFRCREGEVDLVAEEGEVLVFVEVKARSGFRHGLPREAVGWIKQRRIGRAAARYCFDQSIEDRPLRFDVVEVAVVRGEVAGVELIRDAFVPEID